MISTNAIISALGTALGRGTLISIVIVMMVLPQIVLLCDKFIEKTAFGKKVTDGDKAAKREMSELCSSTVMSEVTFQALWTVYSTAW